MSFRIEPVRARGRTSATRMPAALRALRNSPAALRTLKRRPAMRRDRPRRAGLNAWIVMIGVAATFIPAGSTFGQESAAEVTDAQVALYQVGLETRCRQAGRKRGEAPEQVDAFCTCTIRVLRENASYSEWQQAYYYWRKRLNREASALLAPYLPKLQACKDAS